MDVENEATEDAQSPTINPQNETDTVDQIFTSKATENATAQSTSLLLRAAADRALVFFSTASNEKVGASLVGLGAVTYAILGRLGLVIIGLVCGVVLHATWENNNAGGKNEEEKAAELTRRREIGLDVVHRIMAWREKKSFPDDKDLEEAGQNSPIRSSDFSDFTPEIAEALNVLTDAVIRDYVKWWYSPILPADVTFPSTCRKTLASFIYSFSTQLSRKRPADAFLDFTTNSSSIFIVVLNELSSALSASPNSSADTAIHTYLDLKPQCNLASVMDERHQQRKLLMVADDILESFLDQPVYRCSPARVFLREILANVVLEMTIQRCCKSEWINDWIVYLLEDGEPELMNVIDAGVERSTGLGLQPSTGTNGYIGYASPQATTEQTQTKHQRNVSRAEEAMEEAMREAKRLTEMIAEEDAKRAREQQSSNESNADDTSESNTHGVQTPTSSQSDQNGEVEHAQTEATPPSIDRGSQDIQSSGESIKTSVVTDLDPAISTVQTPPTQQDNLMESPPRPRETLTLHKANVSILDDGGPVDRRPLKAKPNIDYLLQVEPASSSFSGWMIPRTYTDFEDLHEILRRISTIAGVPFVEAHATLPPWKGATKSGLRDSLERYLADATHYEQLAESEGMKRFLDKDRGMVRTPGKSGLWGGQSALENVGKGMVDVFTKAPKGVAEGGKAVIGGVTSVFGGGASAAAKKPVVAPAPMPPAPPRQSTSSLSDTKRMSLNMSGTDLSRQSQDFSQKGSPTQGPSVRPSMDERRSSSYSRKAKSSSSSNLMLSSDENLERGNSPLSNALSHQQSSSLEMNLPPLPSNIADDYTGPSRPLRPKVELPSHTSEMSVDGTSFFDVPTPPVQTPSRSPMIDQIKEEGPAQLPKLPKRTTTKFNKQPLSEQEAQVTVELLFAVINELYTLSSAWNIRRTLLGAAKTFLLRPGNPQLENIRTLLQETLLDANTSDSGMAAHILKLRENSLPTEEELAKWPAPLNDLEKEKLRKKARKLLVERGMPQALTSVMGASASGEALGKVFDCLQVEGVARGLIFGLMLQAIRAVTQ